MDIIEIIAIGIGLAMDAFAASICKGLSMKKMIWKNTIIIAAYFGIFHALMPILGYFLGETFSGYMGSIDHWIAFVLLSIIGIKMIIDAFSRKKEKKSSVVNIRAMLPLVIATSIDALAIGVTFALFETNVYLSVAIIGAITFLLSVIGVFIGNKFGSKLQHKFRLNFPD